MTNKIMPNANKMWSTMTNNGTMMLIDYYQKYPELFELAITYRETMALASKVAFLLTSLFVIRNIIQTCVDPFSSSLRMKVSELENRLDEEQNAFEDLDAANEQLKEENEELKKKLVEADARVAKAEAVTSSMLSRYLCCREAAEKFLDTRPAAQSRRDCECDECSGDCKKSS